MTEEKPAEMNMGRHGEQVWAHPSSGTGASDQPSGRPGCAEDRGGLAAGLPHAGLLGGHFTSQGEEAHTSPSGKEVSPLKRLLVLYVTHKGYVMGCLSHRLHADTLVKTYTKFYTFPRIETAGVPNNSFLPHSWHEM